MGLKELLSSLEKNKQKQIEAIWQEANREAENQRQQVADAIAGITKNDEEKLALACQKSMHAIFSATGIKTRKKKLLAFQALEKALRNAAIEQLPALRQKNYQAVFAQLVAELPPINWGKIFVNPDDRNLAARFFAVDIIKPDPTISGGLIAITAEGRMTVDNTFEKRLERKWFLIFPAMIETIAQLNGESSSAEISR